MQCYDAIRARRSVRKYQKGAVIPAEHVKTILEAAMMAPSAVNSRPWEFYVTNKREMLDKLSVFLMDAILLNATVLSSEPTVPVILKFFNFDLETA